MTTTHVHTDTAATAAAASAARLRMQALVTTWICTGLVAHGIAWLLGLEAAWWQRLLLVGLNGILIALDARGVDLVIDARIALTRALGDLGWLQIPLTVAGGAWLTGQMPDLTTRTLLAATVVAVAVLFRYAPSAPAPAGGTR